MIPPTELLLPNPDLVKLVKAGDLLINKYDQKAQVIELLPHDSEYFARLRDLDSEETFAAIAENYSAWRPITNKKL